jgi:quercetin dioxygenase-like cupin family protein
MLPYSEVPDSPIARRPEMFDRQDGPSGRSFRLRFTAGQSLPDHRNVSPILITVERGSGVFTRADEGSLTIQAGDFISLPANMLHSVTADDGGLQLHVALTAPSCECC